MRFTNLKRAKAGGLGTEKSRALPWAHFCTGPWLQLLGCGREAWAFQSSISHSYRRPLRRCRAHRATRDHQSSSWSWAGCCLLAPEPSHCHSQKRGLGCSSLWAPADSPSHRAKRSLNIPVPPRIQIYTVPERGRVREGAGEARERERDETQRGNAFRLETWILEETFIYFHTNSQLKIIHVIIPIWTSPQVLPGAYLHPRFPRCQWVIPFLFTILDSGVSDCKVPTKPPGIFLKCRL